MGLPVEKWPSGAKHWRSETLGSFAVPLSPSMFTPAAAVHWSPQQRVQRIRCRNRDGRAAFLPVAGPGGCPCEACSAQPHMREPIGRQFAATVHACSTKGCRGAAAVQGRRRSDDRDQPGRRSSALKRNSVVRAIAQERLVEGWIRSRVLHHYYSPTFTSDRMCAKEVETAKSFSNSWRKRLGVEPSLPALAASDQF